MTEGLEFRHLEGFISKKGQLMGTVARPEKTR